MLVGTRNPITMKLYYEEYRALRSESQLRIEAIYNQSASAFTAILTSWASAIALLALSYNAAIADVNVLIGFDVAQLFALFIPTVLLFPLAIKSGENLCQITAIACYLRVFYENKNSDDNLFSWESANAVMNPVLQKRHGRPFGSVANAEYAILAIASGMMCVGFSVITYWRIYSHYNNYPAWLMCLHVVIFLSDIIMTACIIYASSVRRNIRDNVIRYMAGFIIFGKKRGILSPIQSTKMINVLLMNAHNIESELNDFLRLYKNTRLNNGTEDDSLPHE